MRRVNSRGFQSARYEACDILKSEGYLVAQVKYGPFNLIAWKSTTDILFIQTITTRCLSAKLVDNNIFKSLMEYTRADKFLGEIQLWVRSRAGWTRYRVCFNGIYPIREGCR